jgi:transposase-like protein
MTKIFSSSSIASPALSSSAEIGITDRDGRDADLPNPGPVDPDPERGALAHRLYREGVPIAEIRARTGFSTGKLYEWVDQRVDETGAIVPDPAPRKLQRGAAAAEAQRLRVLERMWNAAEIQLGEIECRLRALGGAGADIEREARTLAILARVVRELNVQNEPVKTRRSPRGKADGTTGRFPTIRRNAGEPPDDQPARDLGQLRDDLARHLARLQDERAAAGPDRDAQSG